MTPLRVVLLLVGALIITALIIWEKRKQRGSNTFRSATVVDDGADIEATPVTERIEPHLSSPTPADPEPVADMPDAPPDVSVDETIPLEEPEVQTWKQLDLEEEAMRLSTTTEEMAEPVVEQQAEVVHRPAPEPEPAPAEKQHVPEELVILYIVAPAERDIQGLDIRQAMAEAGLQLGDMNLFHYPVVSADAQMSSLFSVADIKEPGYFDADRLVNMSTTGLAVFMQLPGPMSGLEAFDKMLNVARQLSESLYCTLQDERKHDLGRTEIENIKEQILKFNLKLHS